MKRKFTIIFCCIFFVSACSQLGGTRFKRSYISIQGADKQTVGTLFVWEADTSAAILFKDGDACMQTALAIKSANLEAETKLSDAILGLAGTANTIAEKGIEGQKGAEATKEALLDVSGSIQEAASKLTTTTERTAFLNMGMFYICQISANDSVDDLQANELITNLINAAAKIQSYNNAGKSDAQ